MKNIYMLPTDKPSMLWASTKNESYLVLDKFARSLVEYVQPQNIYIISNEQIKEGDWVLSLTDDESYLEVYKYDGTTYLGEDKKIILTTDQYLTGVQAVDDEFLEWFVKNPSCEVVEAVYGLFNPMGRQVNPMDVAQNHSSCVWKYKLIIPQEEPKRKIDACYNFDKEIGCVQDNCRCEQEEPKQETLEEAAENFANSKEWINGGASNWVQFSFKKGAKWQAEKMYSEEEVAKLLDLLERSIKEINHIKFTYKDRGHCDKYLFDCENIIKQFKKK